ncbi:MAG: hypothetical protein N3A60_13335, partial [Thermanaerothrix sp.]|nr:hypothetical protein [Thermanaerothrix sp.]
WGRDNPWEQLWLGHLILLIPLVIVLGITWQVAGNGRTAWRWLALGLTVRACGDGIRWFIVTAQGGYPFVLNSLGLIYGLAALFTAWGLGQYGHPLRTPVSRVRLIVDAFLTSTASLALLWLLIFRAALNSSVVREEMVLWLGLQINWLPILVVLIRLVMAEIRSFPAALGLWGLGWLILALNDQAFFALWQRNAYFVGAPLDVAYNFGLLILGAGALLSIPGVTSISTRGQRGWRYAGLRLQNLFPLLLTLLLGWTVLIQYQLQGRVDLLGLWVTLWLTLGLIARQGLIIGETEFRQYAGLVYS